MPEKDRSLRSNYAKRLILKILASAAAGGVTFLVTERYFNDEPGMSLLTSVFVGGVVLVATTLYETTARLDALSDSVDQHLSKVSRRLTDDFKDLGHAGHLVQVLSKSSMSMQSIAELIKDASKVEVAPPDLASALAQKELDRLRSFVHRLSHDKSVTYQGEDRDWLLTLTDLAQTRIKAISLATVDSGGFNLIDGGLWRSDLGIRYLDRQEKAIKERGVIVQRIFITNVPARSADNTFREIISPQHDIGIQVRLLNPSDLPGNLRAQLEDFIVFDGQLVYMTRAAAVADPADSPKVLTSEITLDPDKIKTSEEQFSRLWEQATDVPGGHNL